MPTMMPQPDYIYEVGHLAKSVKKPKAESVTKDVI